MKSHARNSAFSRLRIATIAMTLCAGSGLFPLSIQAATMPADDQSMVDCMLPGQIQRLNHNVMIMGARHPIRTTRDDCHVRGGEPRAVESAAGADGAGMTDRTAEADPARTEHAVKTHRTVKHHHKAQGNRTATIAKSTPTK